MTIEKKIKKLKNKIEKLKNKNEKLDESLKKKYEMEEWFKSLLNDLEIKIKDNYPYSVYYTKNNNVFFELYQRSRKKYFFCSYSFVWLTLQIKYNLDYDEIQLFIKNMLKKYLKLSGVIPRICAFGTKGWYTDM
jgi:chromosome segregation ATPase